MPIYWAFLTYILLKPMRDRPPNWIQFEGADKLVHILLFVFLGFLFCVRFSKITFLRFIIIMFIYGFSTEILQKIMNFGRAFEWIDLCADILGVTIGYLVTRLIKIK